MQTARTVLQISDKDPGTEIAAETAAALAASSIVFRRIDHKYSRRLLNKAKLVSLEIYTYLYTHLDSRFIIKLIKYLIIISICSSSS